MSIKSEIIHRMELSLVEVMEPDDIQLVSIHLTNILADYTCEPESREMILFDYGNQNLITEYGASLLIAGRSKNTIKQYIREINKLVEYKGMELTKIAPLNIKEYLAYLMVNGLSKLLIVIL